MYRAIIIVLIILILAIISVVAYASFSGGISGPANIKLGKGVLISEDFGTSWKFKNKIDERKNLSSVSVLDFKIDYNDPNIFYLSASKNSVYKTVNGGETWFKLNDLNQALTSYATIYSIALSKANSNLIFLGGIQESQGLILKSEDGGRHFNVVYLVPNKKYSITSVVVDFFNPQIVYAGGEDGVLLQSLDGGISWKKLKQFNSAISTIINEIENPKRFYIILDDGSVLTSIDKGLNWNSINVKTDKSVIKEPGINLAALSFSKLTFESFLEAFRLNNNKRNLFIDTAKPNILYAVFDNEIYRSINYGQSWQKLNFIMPKEKIYISAIGTNPINPLMLYLVAGKYFYKSSDGGENWTVSRISISGVVSSIITDPRNPNKIIITIK